MSFHKKFTKNGDLTVTIIKIVCSMSIVIYIPLMMYQGAGLLKNLDDKDKAQMINFQAALFTSASLNAQEQILTSLSLQMDKNSIVEHKEKYLNSLKLLQSAKKENAKQHTINPDISRLRQDAYLLLVHIIIATGFLQIGTVLADAYYKVRRFYILYIVAACCLTGIVLIFVSYRDLSKLSAKALTI